MKDHICSHLKAVKSLKEPKAYLCEECIKTGDEWVHLRTCQTCGATLCCDSSPNQHMTAHFNSSGHPVASSAEPGERWLYCYADDMAIGY